MIGLVEAAVVKSSKKERRARWQAREETTKRRTESHCRERQCETGGRLASGASVGVKGTGRESEGEGEGWGCER